MSALAVTLICVLIFAVHAWHLFGHRQQMGADARDRPQDPIATRRLMNLSFLIMMAIQFGALVRRVLLAFGVWGELPGLGWVFWAYAKFADFLPLPASDATLFAGFLVFLAGYGLRAWAMRILGRLFTFEIGIRREHKIIEEGPYRFIRHPSYTGYALMLVGIGLAYASLFCLLGMLALTMSFFLLRIRHEETMLLKHFGQPYGAYQKRTKKLIPFLY